MYFLGVGGGAERPPTPQISSLPRYVSNHQLHLA